MKSVYLVTVFRASEPIVEAQVEAEYDWQASMIVKAQRKLDGEHEACDRYDVEALRVGRDELALAVLRLQVEERTHSRLAGAR